MFMLIEQAADRNAAQAQLEAQLKKALRTKAAQTIGFPSGHVRDAEVRTDGTIWFHTRRSTAEDEGATPRTYNWFGQWGDGSQSSVNITVEINIPLTPTARVAGCFVVDPATGVRYLAHSGGVGGGQKGVGQTEFLAWTPRPRIDVLDREGTRRHMVLVMPIDGDGVVAPLTAFVQDIAEFKEAVRAGELDTASFRKKVAELKDYFDEPSGRRRGKRSGVVDYISRHGDVVKALEAWAMPRSRAGTSSKKNVLIDLALERQGTMTDLFEVKTSRDRGDIYTAIGQLMTHARGDACRKHIVLPQGDTLASDLSDALNRCSASVILYEINKTGAITILG
jgi:hypothetical protein